MEDSLKVAAKAAFFEILQAPDSLEEPTEFQFKPKFDTACWLFSHKKHQIQLGEEAASRLVADCSPELAQWYVASYVHHEYAHARYTERNRDKINAMLSRAGCSFSLFNLFEDARIEHRYRNQYGRLFQWSQAEEVSPYGSPSSVFFGLIQWEGAIDTVKALEADDSEIDSILEINVYYQRALAASTSLELESVLRDWVQRFGDTPPPTGSRFSTESDMANSASKEDDSETKVPGKEAVPVDVVLSKVGQVLARSPQDDLPDTSEVNACVNRLRRLLKAKVRHSFSSDSSKKINGLRAHLGRDPFVHATEEGVSRRNLHWIVDCSGSMMTGDAIGHARTLLSAISALSRSGLVTGHVTFSAVLNRVACHETYALPLSDALIHRIEAQGEAEGLHAAIRANRLLIKKADKALVITDGNICDDPLPKAAYRQQGIKLEGIYAGHVTSAISENLLTHFDRICVRETALQLAEALTL